MADPPAVKNNAVGKHRPLFLCNELGDVPFYLHRRLLPRQLEALFEGIEAFAMEAEDPARLLRFTAQGGRAAREELALARP